MRKENDSEDFLVNLAIGYLSKFEVFFGYSTCLRHTCSLLFTSLEVQNLVVGKKTLSVV